MKDKLGTRALATGEIEFEGAVGYPLGPLEEGFRTAVGVLNTSRWLNAVGSTGLMKRTYLEALAFVLWILFMAIATVRLWRRGDRDSRRKAAIVGGSFLLLGVVGASVAQLRHEGIIDFPYHRAWLVFAGLLALGYELSSDVFRATELARKRISGAWSAFSALLMWPFMVLLRQSRVATGTVIEALATLPS